MIKLSVNINKIATLRNARGGNLPDVQLAATNIQRFGAHGITIHPRPDERHITMKDAELLRPLVLKEFNIEGNPTPAFIDLVTRLKPDQVTLVPDEPGQLTSDHRWNISKHKEFLTEIIARFHNSGIRTSIFVDPDVKMVNLAKHTGTDRIELYTESYASEFSLNKEKAIKPFLQAATFAKEIGLEINAGHDLNLENLPYFAKTIPWLKEVSIGHALISEALYLGLENTVQLYLRALRTE